MHRGKDSVLNKWKYIQKRSILFNVSLDRDVNTTLITGVNMKADYKAPIKQQNGQRFLRNDPKLFARREKQ